MAAEIAHEINNPLTYVLANLQVLAERFPAGSRDPEKAELHDLVADAVEGAERIRRVVKQAQRRSPRPPALTRAAAAEPRPTVNLVPEAVVLHAVHEARLDPRRLPFLVLVVAVLAALVVLGGARVDDLELGQHEDDRAVLGEHRIVGERQRYLSMRTGRSATKLITR